MRGWAIAVFMVMAVMAGGARADEEVARGALSVALARAESEAASTPRLAFTETVAEHGVIVSAHFRPVGAAAGRWTPVGAVASGGQRRATYLGIVRDTTDEGDLLLARVRNAMGDEGRLLSLLDGVATFDFAMSPQARPTRSPLEGVLNLEQHVRVQLRVDVERRTLLGMRFYAPRPFAVTPLAHVERLELCFDFGPSYNGGPTIVHSVDTDVSYSLAGVARRTRDRVWFSDVTPVVGLAR